MILLLCVLGQDVSPLWAWVWSPVNKGLGVVYRNQRFESILPFIEWAAGFSKEEGRGEMVASGQVLFVPSTGWCWLAVVGVRASGCLRAQPQIWEERYGTPGALVLPSEVRVVSELLPVPLE